MYPARRQTKTFLLTLMTALVFAPIAMAQSEASSNNESQQPSVDHTTHSQSTSATSALIQPPDSQYTNNTTDETLKKPRQHNHNFATEKASDSSAQSRLKGYARKVQQYQSQPYTQQTPTQQDTINPDCSGPTNQAQQPQFQPNGYTLQQQLPYPDQYAPHTVPPPIQNQYQQYIQPAPNSVNKNRFPRTIPWRFFGGCF